MLKKVFLLLALPLCLLSESVFANNFFKDLLSKVPFLSEKPQLDLNQDGSIRMILLSPEIHSSNIRATDISSDLGKIIQGSSDLPVRVMTELIRPHRSIMGWWYAPESSTAKERLISSHADILLFAESEEIVTHYPEFFFEGVRAVSEKASQAGIRPYILLLSSPGMSHRDKKIDFTASIAYRVGNGCGLSVIPAGYGWHRALFHNRFPGDFPAKHRASAFMAAAATFYQITHSQIPSSARENFWTTEKMIDLLVKSAIEAVDEEGVIAHYKTPFHGTISLSQTALHDLKLYLPSSEENDPILKNLRYIALTANLPFFYKTIGDWYDEGLDRFLVPFDLVYGDQQQIANYLNPTLYSQNIAPTNLPQPFVTQYTRIPEGLPNEKEILSRLETILFRDYDSAKKMNVSYIPYPLAWARAFYEDAKLVKAEVPGGMNDWLSYLLASMIYTASSGRCQIPLDLPKPHLVNAFHPLGFHTRCAKIGYQTMIQLATLSKADNAVLLRNDLTIAQIGESSFARIRLLNKPNAPVQIHCAVNYPQFARLSQNTLLFTPDTYDIEQTVRITPIGSEKVVPLRFMANASSDDLSIEGKGDQRLLLLNYHDEKTAKFKILQSEVSPQKGFSLLVQPEMIPSGVISVTVKQHGMETQEIFFAPDAYLPQPVFVHPTLNDYAKGEIEILLDAESNDLRFHDRRQKIECKLAHGNKALPEIKILSPDLSKTIQGPAFVHADVQVKTQRPIKKTTIYLGKKMISSSTSNTCSGSLEKGPPQSRLAPGIYPIWAEVETKDGVVLSTPPKMLTVK